MKMVKFLPQRVNGQRVKESLETVAARMKWQKQGSTAFWKATIRRRR